MGQVVVAFKRPTGEAVTTPVSVARAMILVGNFIFLCRSRYIWDRTKIENDVGFLYMADGKCYIRTYERHFSQIRRSCKVDVDSEHWKRAIIGNNRRVWRNYATRYITLQESDRR